jgi:nucleoside-diphosphate-sugar epimerase
MTPPQSPRTARPLRHALVTGNTGFIGVRLSRRLEQAGVVVTGVSRAQGVDLLRDELPLAGVEHVFHTAGLTFVPNSWTDPASYYAINANATVRVLDQCRRAAISVTYVSAYVYGSPIALPIPESMPPRPNNPYAFSKLAGEEACRFFAHTFGVRASILRLFNVYGPGQDARFLIPAIIQQVLDPRAAEITVGDVAPRRDFVHVEDVVDALMLAPGLPAGETFNVGSGRSWSVADVIAACLECAGVTKPVRETGERRPNEILDVVADISAIRRACGWQPKTDFAAGIRSVFESAKP